MGWLDPDELRQVLPAEISAFPSPIPTQSVSSDEFMPAPQSVKQREFEARVKQYGAALAHKHGISRRAFFKTAAGMAAAFVAMNDTYGPLFGGSVPEEAWAQFEKTGRVEWVSDLAEIPTQYGVTNVYGDLGQIFAQSTMANPKLCAAMMGILIRGLGADHVCWGTDAIWTGSPQWQIEALRRLEIPEDMQKQYGFQPMGPADGPVKTAILGGNNARLYKYPVQQKAELATDRFAQFRASYEQDGPDRSNRTYGYIRQRLAWGQVQRTGFSQSSETLVFNVMKY